MKADIDIGATVAAACAFRPCASSQTCFSRISWIAALILFAVPLRAQQAQSGPASAQEVEGLRELVHTLQAKVAMLESQALRPNWKGL